MRPDMLCARRAKGHILLPGMTFCVLHAPPLLAHSYVFLLAYLPTGVYRIAGIFGGVFNLAVWRSRHKKKKKKPILNLATRLIGCGTESPNLMPTICSRYTVFLTQEWYMCRVSKYIEARRVLQHSVAVSEADVDASKKPITVKNMEVAFSVTFFTVMGFLLASTSASETATKVQLFVAVSVACLVCALLSSSWKVKKNYVYKSRGGCSSAQRIKGQWVPHGTGPSSLASCAADGDRRSEVSHGERLSRATRSDGQQAGVPVSCPPPPPLRRLRVC